MKRGDGALDWSVLVALIVHPAKVLIVEAMNWIDRPLSPSELEYVFGEKLSVSAISYHVNSLVKYGVLADKEATQSARRLETPMSSRLSPSNEPRRWVRGDGGS